jgi:predicted transcriptional regulator
MSSSSVVARTPGHLKHNVLHYLSRHLGYTTLEQIGKYGASDAREAEQIIRELVLSGLAKRSNKSGNQNSYKITLRGELAIASTFHASLILLVGVLTLFSAIVSLSSISIGGALFALSAGLFGYVYLMFHAKRSLKQ